MKAFTAGFIFLCCFTAAISIVQAQAPYKRILDDPRAFNGPVGTVTDPSSLNSIPIGLFAPFNQDDPAALDLYRGVMLAIEQANATGGYQGVDFNLVQRWAGSPWAAGSKEVVRLVYEDRVWAVIAFRDGAGHIAQQIAAKAYVPVIAPLSSASSLTHTGVPWIFRLPPDDQIQARVLVQDGIVNMYRKFYKLLIIGNSQPTILHIQPGIMEWWNNGIIALHALVAKKKTAAKPAVPTVSAAGVYLPEGRHPIIPFFQHSIIPIDCERSEPEFHLNPVGLVSGTDQNSRAAAAEMEKELNRQNIPAVFHFKVPPGLLDFQAIAERIRGFHPHVLTLCLQAPVIPILLKALQGNGIVCPVGMPWAPGVDAQKLQAIYHGPIYMVQPFHPPARIKTGGIYQQFSRDFEKRFGVFPTCSAAYAYDAARMIIHSIRLKGLNRPGIRQGLEELAGYQGVSGSIIWDNGGGNLAYPIIKEFQ